MTLDAARVREVFEQALTRPLAERCSWLQVLDRNEPGLRQRVEQLLAAHARSTLLSTAVLHGQVAGVLEQVESTDWVGRRLGAYRIQRLLARGGMGMVFLACRDDEAYHQQVAVKVLPATLDQAGLQTRVRRERQILADLQHANISRLLDGGTDEQGRPYLVMEYVAGEPITQYCDRHRLPLARRVSLILQLCEALAYAHRHLIVHCDIKPGNVLVTTDGQVKLLDFGIAQLLNQGDERGAPLTPGYASPEQQQGHTATVTSDLYALGVLSQELLSGQRPRFDAAAPAWLSTQSLSDEAARARGLAQSRDLQRQLQGDLEWTLWRALQPDPDQRYVSATQFADDLRGWLHHEPVSAHPGGRLYRSRKWVLRQPWLALFLSLLMAAGVGYSLLIHTSNQKLKAERQVAITERRQTLAAQQFLLDSLRVVIDNASDQSPAIIEAQLTRGAERAEQQLAADPMLQSVVWQEIGHTLIGLGHYDSARKWLQRALVQQQHQPLSLSRATTLTELARLALIVEEPATAADYANQALTLRQRLHQPPHPGRVMNYQQLAYSAHLRGDYDAAVAYTRRAMALAQDVPTTGLPMVAMALNDLAVWLLNLGNIEEGAKVAEAGIALYRERGLPADAGYLDLQQSLGILDRLAGRYAMAEARFTENLELRRRWYGDDHPWVAISLNNLALNLTFQGLLDQAEPFYEEALAIRRQHYGETHTQTVESLNNLAFLYFDQGRYKAAEPLFRHAWKSAPKAWGDDHSNLAIFETNLAAVLLRLGRLQNACEHAAAAMKMIAAKLGADHWRWAVASSIRGACLYELGEPEQGSDYLRQALVHLESQLGPTASYTREARQRLDRVGLSAARQLVRETD